MTGLPLQIFDIHGVNIPPQSTQESPILPPVVRSAPATQMPPIFQTRPVASHRPVLKKTSAINETLNAEDESPFSDTHAIQDVIIPAHLLQNASLTASSMDDDVSTGWQPGPRTSAVVRELSGKRQSLSKGLSQLRHSHVERPAPVKRSSTAPSNIERSRAKSPLPRNDSQEGQHQEEGQDLETQATKPKAARRSWRLSYTPGSPDSLSVRPNTHRMSSSTSNPYRYPRGNSRPFSSNSTVTTNPFENPDNNLTRHPSSVRLSINPFEATSHVITRGQSFRSSVDPFADLDHTSPPLTRNSSTSEPEQICIPIGGRPRKGTLETIADAIMPDSLQKKLTNNSYTGLARRSSMRETYEKAKTRGVQLQRNRWVQFFFEYGIYVLIILFVYFVLVGIPLWNGAVWWLYWVVGNKFVLAGGFGITLGIALFYAFAPLLVFFEKAPSEVEIDLEKHPAERYQRTVDDTALLIPCYKSAGLIAATLEAALRVFPPSHIFVVANGNSPEPLDNTEEICLPYGVNHVWSPIGSKIVAQFVGCYAAKSFKNVLLIDDDCALPANFPVVTERLVGNVMCIGYTIKSVGPNSSKGNLCQQAQDLEYKLSGLQRDFAGRIGSATFPHGAISLWDRKLLVKTFHEHPGFNVSEDWFFGHVARELGCRIKMCSSTFVETETPTAVFFAGGGSRGGFGEMTIFNQRFKRWNFFFVNGMWYNLKYIFCSWNLGWWEIGAKIFVFQEVYETLLYLLTPFILPISFYVRPSFCGLLLGATIVMYLINVIIFNEVHLRRKGERLGWVLLYVYYLPYKIVLTGINVASCYWSLWKYARYFARRHPKVTEDEKAVEVVVRLEESSAATSVDGGLGRRMTVRTIRTNTTKSSHSRSSHSKSYKHRQSTEGGLEPILPTLPPEIPHLDLVGRSYGVVDEPVTSGMSTPTKLLQGIDTADFAQRGAYEGHGYDVMERQGIVGGEEQVRWSGDGPGQWGRERYSESVYEDNESAGWARPNSVTRMV